MQRSIANLSVAALSVCFCLLLISSGWAAQRPNVFIINSYHQGSDWADDIVEGITDTFKKHGIEAQFYIEYLDTRRYAPEMVFPDLRRLYEAKYKDVRFDIIISADNNAIEFIRMCRSGLFAKVPIVFCGLNPFDDSMLEGLWPITGVVETFPSEATIAVALKLHPLAKQVVIVRNKPEPTRNTPFFVVELPGDIKLIFVDATDLTFEQLLQKLESFDNESILFFSPTILNSAGEPYPDELVAQLVQRCDAPVYMNNFSLIGRGVVGGCINKGIHHGKLAGEMAVRVLGGESAEKIPIMRQGPSDYVFDYNQLRRFGFSMSKLPPNSHIINEPKSFYYRYKTRVWLVGSVFLVLAGMILLLLSNIIKRRRVESKLLSYQVQLKSLASQLSLTEERERRRIATGLHDRISQSLVISKVMLEQLRENEASDHVAGVLDDACNMLGQTIENSRLLTFDLSSPILYELGFEAAVAELLTEQVGRHNIVTELEDDGQVKPLDNDIRGILFRMVRGLLINVVKHAQARQVRVSINRADTMINICVQDDGVGFEPDKITSFDVKAGEFGLFSIRERLEQLGGRLDIKSSPGRGCRVHIAAPLKV